MEKNSNTKPVGVKQKLTNAMKNINAKKTLIVSQTIVLAFLVAIMVHSTIQERKQIDKKTVKTEVSWGDLFSEMGKEIAEEISLVGILKGLGITVLVLGGGLICVVIGAQAVYQVNENKNRKKDYLLFNLNKQDIKSGNFQVKRLSPEEYTELEKIGTKIDGMDVYVDENGIFSIPEGLAHYSNSWLLGDQIYKKTKEQQKSK